MSRRKGMTSVGLAAAMALTTAAGPTAAGEAGIGAWLSRTMSAKTQGTGSAPQPGADPSRATPASKAPGPETNAKTAPAPEKNITLAKADGDRRQAGYQAWVKRFWGQAKAAGISRSTYRRAFAEASYDPSVIKAASRQAEFVKPIWEYLDSAVSPSRVENGRRMKDELSEVLDRIEKRFGVEREIVLAIWGMESAYGAVLENSKVMRSVVSSLSTLAYAGGRRARFGRKQLLAALKILESGDVTAANMTGSWAGAMGHTQFIPTTYLAYAVDMDGDRRRDIWDSIPDALASTANYLRASGWRTGQTWGYEVDLPSGFNYKLADKRKYRPTSYWTRLGVKRTYGRAFPQSNQRVALFLPAGAKGPAFLLTSNFRSILRYNNADSYALAVGHLADRIIGAGPFEQEWPRADRPLAAEEREELASLLAEHGHAIGELDRKPDPKARAAIRSVQKRLGLPADGHASAALLARLKSETK